MLLFKKVMPATLMTLINQFIFCQTFISLDSAVVLSRSHNLDLIQLNAYQQQQQLLKKVAGSLDPTNLVVDYGQLNSAFKDKKISVNQSFTLPHVIAQKKQYINEDIKKTEWARKNYLLDLHQQLAIVFYETQILYHKQHVHQRLDTILNNLIRKTQTRIEHGDAAALDKIIADNQALHNQTQLHLIEQNIAQNTQRFNLLINDSNGYYAPQYQSLFSLQDKDYKHTNDTITLAEHPILKTYFQNIKMAQMAIALEKNKKFPTLSVGYNIGSIQGVGADNIRYGSQLQFHTMQIGLALPLFLYHYQDKITIAKLNHRLEENAYQFQFKKIKSEYDLKRYKLNKYTQLVQQYQQHYKDNAKVLYDIAEQQLMKGEISFLQWVMMIQNATQTELDYLNLLYQYHQARIELAYFEASE